MCSYQAHQCQSSSRGRESGETLHWALQEAEVWHSLILDNQLFLEISPEMFLERRGSRVGEGGGHSTIRVRSGHTVLSSDHSISRLMNLNLEELQGFQSQNSERRQELIYSFMEEVDLIIFHLDEQEVVRWLETLQQTVISNCLFSNILRNISDTFAKIAGFSVDTFQVNNFLFSTETSVFRSSAFWRTIPEGGKPSVGWAILQSYRADLQRLPHISHQFSRQVRERKELVDAGLY